MSPWFVVIVVVVVVLIAAAAWDFGEIVASYDIEPRSGKVNCPRCHGSGRVAGALIGYGIKSTCPECEGQGEFDA